MDSTKGFAMKLTHLGSTSKNGSCPELYKTDRGTHTWSREPG